MKNRNQKKIRIILMIFIILIAIGICTAIVFRIVNRKQVVDNEPVQNDETKNENVFSNNKPSIFGDENVKIENGIKKNTSSKISEDKKFESYTFSNIKLQTLSSTTVFTAKVSSSSPNNLEGREIVINFYDDNKNLISSVDAYIGQIKVGETINFKFECITDLSNVYDMEIVEK